MDNVNVGGCGQLVQDHAVKAYVWLTVALLVAGKQMNMALSESLSLRYENKDLLESVTVCMGG